MIRSLRLGAATVAALVTAAGRAPAQQVDLSRPLPFDTQVVSGTLPNGIRYYVRANHRPEKRAELRLAVNAGSVLEADDQRGIAHFVEHMAFNGTEHFRRQELVNYLESIGMRFGPDVNAFTGFDETVYLLTVPTDTGTFLERGLQILEDWADGQLFDTAEVNRERGVVIEEWRLGRGAESRMRDRQFPVLFQGSRYAERLPIGLKEQLEKFTAADLRRFYRTWYRPDLMAVVAVGDFDAAKVEALIRERFRGVGQPGSSGRPGGRPVYPVPDHRETLVSIATDKEATNSRVAVYYKQPLRIQKSVGDYRQELVERLYNAMLDDRFFEITQKPDAPFLFGSSGQGRFVRSSEVYVLSAGVKDGGITRGLDALLTEGQRVTLYGFTSTELERHKADVLRGMESAFAERDKTYSAQYAGELTRAYLEEEPVPGIATEYDLTKRLLPGITLEEVNRLALQWMTDRNRVILANAPDKPGVAVPTERDLLGAMDAVRNQRIEPYQDLATDHPLVAAAPTGAPVVAEQRIPELGIWEWTLGNGVRVVLKPTDFQNDEVLMTAWSPGGSSLAPDSTYVAASTATTVVRQGGVGEFSLVDLQKRLSGTEADVRPVISSLGQGFSGSASPKDIETLFELTYLYFTAPRRDSSAFVALQQQFEALLKNRGASPLAAFQDTLQVTLAQHAFRARPTTAATFREMNLDRSLAFYRDRFADASGFVFFFVGSFTPDSLKPLVQRWLGGLPALHRSQTWKDEGIRPPVGIVKREVRKGLEPRSQTRIAFTGPFEYTRESRYALRALGDVMEIRLRDKLREELGATYSVSVGPSASRDPVPRYSFSIDFGSAPERVDELVRSVFTDIKLVQDSGATPSEVAKVKETQRRTRETNLRQNGFWLGQLEAYWREGGDPREILRYDELVSRLTSQIIRDAARKYLRLDNYVQVSLFPETFAPAPAPTPTPAASPRGSGGR